MDDQKPLGGFFEIELARGNGPFHTSALPISNGRSCLSLILHWTKPSLIYLPFYCCDSLLEPLQQAGVAYRFYTIDVHLELNELPILEDGQLLLYINYFGIKSKYAAFLSEKYRDKIVIDNTQAFFERASAFGWSFNSARKFFGVPDGAYLYGPFYQELPSERNERYITDHLIFRLQGRQAEAFASYQKNEALQESVPRRMSFLSQRILSTLDYDYIKERRLANFTFFKNNLGRDNMLQGVIDSADGVPCYFPLLLKHPPARSWFYENDIFLPTLWKEVQSRPASGFDVEKQISAVLPLPLDHRYNESDLKRITSFFL